jgi:cytochrome c biogenesis protein CcmG/thiol:disulfide interchange protein DsbE
LLTLGRIGGKQVSYELNSLGHGNVGLNLPVRVTGPQVHFGVVWSQRRMLLAGGLVVVVLVAAAAVWFALLQPAQTTTTMSPVIAQVGAPAPSIALPVVGGGTSNLAADRGKVVLVNFWATWCEPCKAEMPGLQQLADELSNQPFRLYSVDLQEDEPQIQAFEQQYNLRLYAVMDEDGTATRAYGVRALPSTFLIDQKGTLHLQRLGPLASGGTETTWSEPWLADQVRALLASG